MLGRLGAGGAPEAWIFRQGRRPVEGARLVADLGRAITAGRTLDALLGAGELECVLADEGSPGAAILAGITDRLADALIADRPIAGEARAGIAAALAAVAVPERPLVSPPESFAYYGLHPRSFAALARGIALPEGRAAVVGIRTIGVTLSAVVAAELRSRGAAADRVTVRPTGAPRDRRVDPTDRQRCWVEARVREGARFLVTDEGPGMSGSSFLAAGEALVRAGAAADRVTFLGTRAARFDELSAPDAARRYAAFADLSIAPPTPAPADAGVDLSAGAWRRQLDLAPAAWPAVWPMLERLKYLSADGRRLLKFEGLGAAGEAVRERAGAIAEAGLGPSLEDAGDGFVAYRWLGGRPLARADRDPASLARLAEYCAFRVAAFPAPDADPGELAAMARENALVVLGAELDPALAIERPVIADARMRPHEWIRDPGGALFKVDAAAHGDGHCFPGPTDAAWDLAGAVVEWELDGGEREVFLERYRRASGDRAEPRLGSWVTAYLVQQLGHTALGEAATWGTADAARFRRERRRYLRRLAAERGAGGEAARRLLR